MRKRPFTGEVVALTLLVATNLSCLSGGYDSIRHDNLDRGTRIKIIAEESFGVVMSSKLKVIDTSPRLRVEIRYGYDDCPSLRGLVSSLRRFFNRIYNKDAELPTPPSDIGDAEVFTYCTLQDDHGKQFPESTVADVRMTREWAQRFDFQHLTFSDPKEFIKILQRDLETQPILGRCWIHPALLR